MLHPVGSSTGGPNYPGRYEIPDYMAWNDDGQEAEAQRFCERGVEEEEYRRDLLAFEAFRQSQDR